MIVIARFARDAAYVCLGFLAVAAAVLTFTGAGLAKRLPNSEAAAAPHGATEAAADVHGSGAAIAAILPAGMIEVAGEPDGRGFIGRAEFYIRNVGAVPLRLKEVFKDCACTVVEFDREAPIRPGDSSRIVATVTASDISGRLVRIQFATEPPSIAPVEMFVKVKPKITPPLLLSSKVNLGYIPPRPCSQDFEVYTLEARASKAWIDCFTVAAGTTIRSLQIRACESTERDGYLGRKYRVSADLPDAAGFHALAVDAISKGRSVGSVAVTLERGAWVVCSPQSVDFLIAPNHSTDRATRILYLRRFKADDQNPFHPTVEPSSVAGVDWRLEPPGEVDGSLAKLTISVDQALFKPGTYETECKIKTGLELEPNKRVSVRIVKN